jgi:hypothetical protein
MDRGLALMMPTFGAARDVYIRMVIEFSINGKVNRVGQEKMLVV